MDYGNEEETEIQKLRRPLGDPLFDLPPQVRGVSGVHNWGGGVA